MKCREPVNSEPPAVAAHPVTTRTLAQAAGVDVSTVSRALRGVTGVSPAERDRIRGIAKRLGYRPNPFVTAFVAQIRTYRRAPAPATIALLDCWPVDRPVWANFDDSLDYIGGVRDRADNLGYRVERIRLIDLENSLDCLQRLLSTRRIYGLLVLPVPEGTDLSGLDFSRLACATIDFSLQRPALIRRASPHYYHNMWVALTTLAKRGHRRLGFVTTMIGAQRGDHLSLAAFLAFRVLHPHLCAAPCLIDDPAHQHHLAAWVRREHPDALITSDFLLPDALVNAGCRVPEDISAITLTRPPDTTRHVTYIDENYREIGAQAVNMVVDAIHRNEFGLPTVGGNYLVDGVWHEGSTVRAFPREQNQILAGA